MQNIKTQKIKLTIFFTILVFLLALFLEIIFFSFKYLNEKKVDKQIFVNQTKIIYNKINKQKDIIDLFENTFLDNNLGKIGKNIKIKHNKKINYLILNKSNEIVDKKVFENIDYILFDNLKYNKFYIKNNIFILEKKLNNNILGDKIIFYKSMHYQKTDLFKDLLFFIFITFISTIIFYIIGNKFVGIILKPVEQNIEDMKNFIHNSSHEFKTPISIIHSNLQIIQLEEKYDKELVKETIDELENFNKLINSLTQLSGIGIKLKKEKIKLKKEIPELIAEYISKIKKRKIKVNFIVKNNIKIFANKGNFRILFLNLLSNAIKYNNIGGKIDIILEKNKLIIRDSGIGIEEKNKEKIFDRFFRENNSKTKKGFGIGLSLVLKICELNKWKISVKSQKNKGTEFIIEF